MKKVIGIESFVKNCCWLGDRTTAPSLLVRALYRCDHQVDCLVVTSVLIFRTKSEGPLVRSLNQPKILILFFPPYSVIFLEIVVI